MSSTISPCAATHEERMRNITISKETRDYFVAYGRLEDLWDFVDDLITRDYDCASRESDRFGELMAKVAEKLESYMQQSVDRKLCRANATEI